MILKVQMKVRLRKYETPLGFHISKKMPSCNCLAKDFMTKAIQTYRLHVGKKRPNT